LLLDTYYLILKWACPPPVEAGAGLYVHTAQGISHRPVPTSIPHAEVGEAFGFVSLLKHCDLHVAHPGITGAAAGILTVAMG